MLTRTVWRIAMVLAALGMSLGGAHALELPQKLTYDAELYSAVNTTLYRYFAPAGAVLQVGTVASLGFLYYRTRGTRPCS